MTEELEKFCSALEGLIKSFEQKNLSLKMQQDLDLGMVKIYGQGVGALERAKAGLDEVAELAYDTAEHHPYWNLLYDGSQILKIILERWHENLTEDEVKEIRWYADKMKDSLSNIASNDHH